MRPCPVRIRTRRVYVGESDSAPLRSIYVRDLTLQAGVNRARRGPALASPVDAGRADEWHGETWSFEITQELYASYDEHDVLLRACAMVATPIDDDDLRRYTPAAHARSARTPCYIEIIEIGGSVLRATDCVGTVRLSADPADIPRLVFSMTGRFLEPIDAPAIPVTPRVGARPVLYRNADLYIDDIGIITCPAVEFETGGSVYETPELHRPSGVALDSYHDTTARLTLDGTLTARESSQLVWSVRRGDELTLALPDDEVELSLYDWTIDPPAHATEGPFLAYALTFRADSWSLTLPRDRSLGVAPTIDPIGEDIDGTRYVFTESVEVTGTATPDSVIAVNGQSVSVDSDGNWTTMVTLSEGPNTITAQAGDGQIAQTSVTLWAHVSFAALEPNAWWSTRSVQYVDEERTQIAGIGDPCSVMINDGIDGSMWDLYARNSASRPIVTEHGLRFDGSQNMRIQPDLPAGYLEWGFSSAASATTAGSAWMMGGGANSARAWNHNRPDTRTGHDDGAVDPPVRRQQSQEGQGGVIVHGDDRSRVVTVYADSTAFSVEPTPLDPVVGFFYGSVRSSSLYYNGTIHEAAIFLRDLTDTELHLIAHYMQARYNEANND